VDPRAVLDAVVKRKIPSPRRESNPRAPIVQSVALTTGKSYWGDENQPVFYNVSGLTTIIIFLSI
jgi:hypothetical protein